MTAPAVQLDTIEQALDDIRAGKAVVVVDDESFGVALIPYTLSETTLGTIAVGDELNLEVDVLAKYVERLIAGRIASFS